MRRSLCVAVLCLFVASNSSAADQQKRDLIRESPLEKIVRMVKKTITSLGDGLTTPRP